jgi:hypothetical protein
MVRIALAQGFELSDSSAWMLTLIGEMTVVLRRERR